MTREEFKAGYRVVRLMKKHRVWAAQEIKRLTNPASFGAAMAVRYAHPWLNGVESAKGVRLKGLSFKKCISLHLAAVKRRMKNKYSPHTRRNYGY